MFFYEGYSCPVCQKQFTEGDDIVTCPDCGAPHHRACWKENARCFYAEKHNTPDQWSREKTASASENPSYDTENSHICSHCGTKNSAFAEFCSHCGRDLEAEEWASTQQAPHMGGEYREYSPFSAPMQETFINDSEDIDGVKARDLRLFVGPNAQYYLPRFNKFAKSDTFI
ncbi:MAG: zinc-ribbon domain-containing protein, partial [Clostridia bacterium]|nr:zinc-ribbon domain-containing protein [Clostridia bacterium]